MWGSDAAHPVLGSGKHHVKGIAPGPGDPATATADAINREIVARVGVETAPGTPNYFSHFVPCADADSRDLSIRFGKGACFGFKIVSVLYGPHLRDIEQFVAERDNLPDYAIPMFKGGKGEWLAYTGSLITSVTLERAKGKAMENMNSLD